MGDQFSLFAPHVEHQRAAEEAALALDFDGALVRISAAAYPGPLLPLLRALAGVKTGRGKLGWVKATRERLEVPGLDLIPGLAAKLAGAAAEALETLADPGASVDGLDAGGLWARAGQPGRALAAWEAAARRSGRAADWIVLGNAHFAAKAAEAARDAYARGLASEPLSFDVSTAVDPAITDLFDTTDDLIPEGEGDPRLWMLPVGLLDGTFLARFGRDTTVPDVMALTATPAERAKAATAALVHASFDRDPLPARRVLKAHAPWLLPRLVRRT
mgnify:CR=1 FL=1